MLIRARTRSMLLWRGPSNTPGEIQRLHEARFQRLHQARFSGYTRRDSATTPGTRRGSAATPGLSFTSELPVSAHVGIQLFYRPDDAGTVFILYPKPNKINKKSHITSKSYRYTIVFEVGFRRTLLHLWT